MSQMSQMIVEDAERRVEILSNLSASRAELTELGRLQTPKLRSELRQFHEKLMEKWNTVFLGAGGPRNLDAPDVADMVIGDVPASGCGPDADPECWGRLEIRLCRLGFNASWEAAREISLNMTGW